MKIAKSMSRKQFAAAIVKQLKEDEISAVLVGGACISIYTNDRHESKDLDFISAASTEAIASSLKKIGFKKKERYFVHSESEFYVEFPTGPISIGNATPVKPEGKIKVRNTIVPMLSPTQSVMDRLSAFFHWNDRRSLIHAIWVCEEHPINIEKIKRWAAKEREPEKFDQFLEAWRKIKGRKKQRQ